MAKKKAIKKKAVRKSPTKKESSTTVERVPKGRAGSTFFFYAMVDAKRVEQSTVRGHNPPKPWPLPPTPRTKRKATKKP